MAKLAEGTGMKVPESARAALYGVQEPAAPKVSVNLLFPNINNIHLSAHFVALS